MDNRSYGIVINVDDLGRARHFYKEVIGLGAPVVDSNNWIEFQMPNGLILGLLHQAKASKEKAGSCLWILFTSEYDEIKDRLKMAEIRPLKVPAPPMGVKAEVFADPEGNRFALVKKTLMLFLI